VVLKMFKFIADHNNRKIVFQIENKKYYVKGAIRQAFYKIGKDLRTHVKEQVLDKTKKTGRLYHYQDVREGSRFSKTLNRRITSLKRVTRQHRASAPGEYAANLSGEYRKSFNFTVIGSSELIFGNSVSYAAYLEKGTKRMKPRPALQMAIESLKGQAQQTLINEINKVL
jgi:HK97 gp10 family phage protein